MTLFSEIDAANGGITGVVYYQCKTAPGLFRTVASAAIDDRSYVHTVMWLQSTVKLCDKCTRTIDVCRPKRFVCAAGGTCTSVKYYKIKK